MEPERGYDIGYQRVETVSATLLTTGAISTLLAIIVVTIATIILDPPASSPFATAEGRAHFLIVLASAVGVGVWRSRALGGTRGALTQELARGFLITMSPALFLIGRVVLLPIFLVLILAAGIAYFDTSGAPTASSASGRAWPAIAALTWFALVGISSLEIEGRVQFPLVAAISVAAILWHTGTEPGAAANRASALTAGVIGLELAIATSFLNISPYTEATLWMAGIGLVGAGYLLAWRAATS